MPLLHKDRLPKWALEPGPWAELFALFNLAFLAVDISLAHSFNRFARWPEWIPIGFSVAGPAVLLAAWMLGGLMVYGKAGGRAAVSRWLGGMVGWGAILVGVAGFVLHLNSQFFQSQTLKSLVYTAPFAALTASTVTHPPILLNRTVDPRSAEWGGWVTVLAVSGFAGNFVLSLADHAQNGLWNPAEWAAVIAAALAVGFLLVPILLPVNRRYLRVCFALMVMEAAVGVVGEGYHVSADLRGPSAKMLDNFIYGAPAFAPLLFANLALLAAIGLWKLYAIQVDGPARR